MNDKEFRAFLDLMMCSDPWPGDAHNHTIMLSLANKEAKKRRFDNWITAFHSFKKGAPRINVFDNGGRTFDRYTVIIDQSIFAMSHNASSPQGVNQYAGPVQALDSEMSSHMGELLPHIPGVLKRAIKERQQELAGGS